MGVYKPSLLAAYDLLVLELSSFKLAQLLLKQNVCHMNLTERGPKKEEKGRKKEGEWHLLMFVDFDVS